VFTKNKYVYLINEEEEGESYEDVSSVLSDGSEDSHLNLRGSGCLSLLQYDFDVDKRTFFTLTNKTKIDFETGILHVYVGGMEEFCSLKKLVEKKIFFAVDL
jgi:hypothetical protein